METKNKAWYVGERAELLSQLFLQDLGLQILTRTPQGPVNFVVQSAGEDRGLCVVGVVVKATERPVERVFEFRAARSWIDGLQHANIPILVLVADVKHNAIYYGWGDEISFRNGTANGKQAACKIPVSNAEGKNKEILDRLESKVGA